MNFMNINGECGNFNSAINSLKWFGYGDKVKLTKLLKTDNTLLDQSPQINHIIFSKRKELQLINCLKLSGTLICFHISPPKISF